MVNVLDRQVELVLVMLDIATVLTPSVGQNPEQWNVLRLKEGQHPVIEQVGELLSNVVYEEELSNVLTDY